MDKKEQIIREWEKVEPRHPSMSRIAKKVGVSKGYVHQVVKEYTEDLKQNKWIEQLK